MKAKKQVLSAIDIGSNAIRMLIAEESQGQIRILKKFRDPVRLGHDSFTEGEIKEKTMQQVFKSFHNFSEQNKKFKVEKCRAVATSAIREAKNRQEFVKKVFQNFDIKIEVIDGIEEARLIHEAVANQVDLKDKKVILIDVGGGSVEVTFSDCGSMRMTRSFPLGTVRLLERLKKRKLQESHLSVLIGEFIEPLVAYLNEITAKHKLDFAVGTGGNLESMRKLKTELLKKNVASFVLFPELVDLSEKLKEYSYDERVQKLNLRPDRADVILPALMLVKTILRQASIDKIFIPGVGLRDGLLRSIV